MKALTNEIYAGQISVATCLHCGSNYAYVTRLKHFSPDESVFEFECESTIGGSPINHPEPMEMVVRNYKGELQVFTRLLNQR